jgi:hypothetical protein
VADGGNMEYVNLIGIGENSNKQMWEIEKTQLGPLVVLYDKGKLEGPMPYGRLIKSDPYWRDPTEEEIKSIKLPAELEMLLNDRKLTHRYYDYKVYPN